MPLRRKDPASRTLKDVRLGMEALRKRYSNNKVIGEEGLINYDDVNQDLPILKTCLKINI